MRAEVRQEGTMLPRVPSLVGWPAGEDPSLVRSVPGPGVSAFASLLLAACTAQAPHTATSIRIAHESEALTLDPVAFTETATISVLSNSHEALVAFDKNMNLVP